MSKINKRILVVAILLMFVSTGLFSIQIPKLTKRINDQANVLTDPQEKELESLLINVENRTTSQLALLIIKSLEGENLELYSIQVAANWKLGQKEFDNGALFLISMKEKKIRIEVGYGLEDIITDLKAKYIINTTLVPYFKDGDFFGGIKKSFEQIGGLITKEFDITPEELAKYQKRKSKSKNTGSFPISIIFFILFILLGGIGGGRNRRKGSGIGWFLLGSAMSGGSSRSSGFGGGGFGGFSGGGGSFGGGGASGGW